MTRRPHPAASWLEPEPARWFVPPGVELRDASLWWPQSAEPVYPQLADRLALAEAQLLSAVPLREKKKRAAIRDSMKPGPEAWKAETASPSLLSEFLEIGTDLGKLERFATKYGPLPWCPDHAAPRTHDPVCFRSFAEHGVLRAEPVKVWFDLIALFGAIVRTFDRIQAKAEIEPSDARIITDFAIPTPGGTTGNHAVAEPEGMRSLIAVSATTLSRHAGFVPTVSWGIGHDGREKTKPQFSVGIMKWCLFSALVARLLGWILSEKLRCSGCDSLYDASERKRRPKSSQENYCATCRANGVPNKIRNQMFRARKKSANDPTTRRGGTHNAPSKE